MSCKWVFKRKLTASGSVERYKARLVLRGFEQRFGTDYLDIFAPVARRSTVRLFFSLVASLDLECHQIDITNAFIQGDLEEQIFMQQPPGFGDGTSNVCHLHKSLYGLKQAPRVWYQTLAHFLLSCGFEQSPSDPAVLYCQHPKYGLIYVMLYVDDIQIACKQLSGVIHTKKFSLRSSQARI